MCVFFYFWKLETENNHLHVFSFFHKLSFEFFFFFFFLSILSYQTSILVSKIENYFWKLKIRRKNSYQTYPKSLKENYFILREYHKCVLSPLTWIVGLTMNLTNRTHHSCERNEYIFMGTLGVPNNFLSSSIFTIRRKIGSILLSPF